MSTDERQSTAEETVSTESLTTSDAANDEVTAAIKTSSEDIKPEIPQNDDRINR